MTDALNQDSTATVGDTVYPFSAIVGQEPMKLALILAAIHPGLGGVLIRGSKGAAKSTAVRALAALVPDIDVVPDDPIHRAPGEVSTEWPLPDVARFTRRPVSLVNLPVGATGDRVVGSLNFERALTTGRRTFEPGLLAAAHRGRMARTKGAVLSLLIDAYQKRDRVGLIVFGGTSATLGLPPTRSVRVAARHLDELPVGGPYAARPRARPGVSAGSGLGRRGALARCARRATIPRRRS